MSHRPPTEATLRRLERSSGALATQAVARMDDELSWFRAMPADRRSWVTLVAQAGIASLVEWCRNPGRPPRLTGDVFGAAPRELVRVVALKQTVDLIKVTVDVLEDHVRTVAEPGDEDALHLAVLQFSREVAFATAHVYASFAENRGAWDARLEALVVDALVRGERSEELSGRAAALGWATNTPGPRRGRRDAGGRSTTRTRRSGGRRGRCAARCSSGVHAEQLVVVLGRHDDLEGVADRVSDEFGDGPVVTGPVVDGLGRAGESAAVALAGLRAARAWPDAPRARWRPTRCSPSGPWTATRWPGPRCTTGWPRRCRPPAARCSRRCARCSTAAATSRPARGRSSCTRTPCGTGSSGPPSSPACRPPIPAGSWTLQVALALAAARPRPLALALSACGWPPTRCGVHHRKP